jgi:helicase
VPEEIRSKLGNQPAIRTHVLASIAGGFTRSREDLKYFLAHTFYAQRSDPVYLLSITDDIVAFLRSEGMVEGDEVLIATRFGHRISELYIDPLSGVLLRDALQIKKDKEAFSLLHMVVRTPDMMVLQVKKNNIDDLLGLYHANSEKLLIPKREKQPTEEMLAQVKTAWALMQWIQETPEDDIVGRFDIGPGDLHALVELADWLFYSASEIARIFGLREEVKIIFLLRTRVLYGVKEELLPLVSLKNIGRIRARNLFNAGYKSPEEIKKASAEKLSKVPAIGKTIADDIKRQVEMAEKGIAAAGS